MKIQGPSPDLSRIVKAFKDIPQCQLLGLKFIELQHGKGWMSIDYDKKLIGNPQTGVVHGGAITTLLDTLCGAVVLSSVPENTPVATLDLRIDYLHPAKSVTEIRGSAECYKVTANIAFVRGLAYHDTTDDPIAHCAGTFMLGATGFNPASGAENEQGGQPC